MEILQEVFHRLSIHGLFLKPKKCTVAAPSIELLGHVINRDGVNTAPSKIEAMAEYPSPKDRAEVRAVMGTFSYYRSFIKNFSKVAAPINSTLRQDINFKWTPEAEEAFKELKKRMTTAPILARPDLTQPFTLQTDACKTGLGAVLTQLQQVMDENNEPLTNELGQPIKKEVVICYVSTGTNKHE